MKSSELPWLEAGYITFAMEGPTAIKVERLARSVGKNKSSFYFLFADIEVFIGHLLRYHMEQVEVLAEKEAQCSSLEELIELIVANKTDLLFNRQLKIHRENPEFEACFCKTNQMTVASITELWKEMLGLENESYLAGLVLKLSLENFYLQITDETLNKDWLNSYFAELQQLVQSFKNMNKKQVLDGSV